MKLKTKIDEYNVADMEGVEAAVRGMTRRCVELEELGRDLKSAIAKAREDGFQDTNCDRAEEEIEEYCRNLCDARMEFEELAESVKAFTEKIHDIWNSWRR